MIFMYFIENQHKYGSSDKPGGEYDSEQPLQLGPGASHCGERDSSVAAAHVPHRGEAQVSDGLHELVQNCWTGKGKSPRNKQF